MAPPDLNDPAMHTAFILNPHDIFLRYTEAFTPTARLREGARVGFLVPGRISYLLFGAFAGFVALRYMLALIAVVPTYILLRRLYGRVAGMIGVIVILSSPVIITAWGTDFPDSAAVSYLTGGLVCLAMPARRHPTPWLLAGAGLMTMAVWTFASSAPLVAATVGAYWLIRIARDRTNFARDAAYMAAAAVAVTGVLVIASGLVLGRFDYITPTIRSLIYLAHHSQVVVWHSSSWRWAPYVAYLIVPPTVVMLWLVAFSRRALTIPASQLVIGLACAAQLSISALLQFFGNVQMLEVHYFSSLLWGAVCVALALAIVELGRPLLDGAILRWLFLLALVAVPLAYELDPHVPAFGWLPYAVPIAGVIVLLAVTARLFAAVRPSTRSRLVVAASLALVSGGLTILTVAAIPSHTAIPGTVYYPPPAYASALGGDASHNIDLYRTTAELPAFVGTARYSGEQLLMWWPEEEMQSLLEPIGIYHAFFDSVPGGFGELGASGRSMIEQRKPAQVLLLSYTGERFAEALTALGPFRPELLRTGVLRSGSVALHVWLISLNAYLRA
jgi:hypothetical protein